MDSLIRDINLAGSNIPRLEALREKGRRSFLAQGLPGAKTEAWKYTRVRDLAAGGFIPAAGEGHAGGQNLHRTCPADNCGCCESAIMPFAAYEIKFCNGYLTDGHFHLPEGVEAMTLLQAIEDSEAFACLNKNFDMDQLPFAALNTACLEQGIFLRIARDTCPDKPIVLISHTDGKCKHIANIRNVIVLENGARAVIAEYFYCSGAVKAEYFNNLVNEIYIGRHAGLEYYKVQNESFKASHIALNAVCLKENGIYKSFCLQKGANLARHETRVMLQERHAEAVINAAYIMNGWATLDTTTNIEHLAPETYSRQLVKGVVGGQAKGVFQGKIHIAPDAVKTEGFQLHKALLLSDQAEVDVKPELEIFADDVRCSHGAASGEPDAEQLFYLRARGISEEDARQILVRAFIDDVINQAKNDNIRSWLQSFQP